MLPIERKLEYSLYSTLFAALVILAIGIMCWMFSSLEHIQSNIDSSLARRRARSDFVYSVISIEAVSFVFRVMSLLFVILSLRFLFGTLRNRTIVHVDGGPTCELNLANSVLFKPRPMRVSAESIMLSVEGKMCLISAKRYEDQNEEIVKTVPVFLIMGRRGAVERFMTD